MAEEILENPVTGEVMKVLESTPDTFRIEYALKAHGAIPLEHCHPGVEQEIAVREGEMHITVNGEHVVIKAGESAIAPRSALHYQWNPCDEEAIALETYRPAGRNHDFFRTLFGIARDGHTNAMGMPSMLMSAAIFNEFHDTIQPASRTTRWQVALLAPVARLLGYHARLRKYQRTAAV